MIICIYNIYIVTYQNPAHWIPIFMVNSQRLWELDVTVEAPSASEVYPSIQVYWGYPHGEWKKKPPLMVDYLGLYYLQMTWELSDIPKKRKLPCHLQSEKNRRMHKSRVICKVPRKKKSHDMGPLQLFGLQKYAKHVMSTNSHSVHFTSHMNKDSIWVYNYLLAVRIIQNYTSAAGIFQSHMNPFTSLFYLATI